MKMLIAYILAATSLLADTVHFSWTANTEPDLNGYVLQIGTSLADGEFFNIPKEATHATAFMQPHQRAWLRAASDSGGWSDPAGPLEYKPVAVEVFVQSTRLGPNVPWTSWELFRIDESLFNPDMANIPMRLNITRDRLDVTLPDLGATASFPLNTKAHPDEFFRSYVAFRSL